MFFRLPNLHMLIKQKIILLPRNLALRTFGELLIVFSTMVNLLYLLYSAATMCYLLPLIKRNCLLKTFLRIFLLMTQVSFLPVLPSRTNLKLHNIYIIPKMVKKVIANLDLSKMHPSEFTKKSDRGNMPPMFQNLHGKI